MSHDTISVKYPEVIKEMLRNSAQSATVTEDNIFQPGNMANRVCVEKILKDYLLPGSRVSGLENIEELQRLSVSGKSCLLLMEHYSNFDLPALCYLLERSGKTGKAAADSLIAIAGLKLNEESAVVLAFSEAYSRIVIYPSRYFDHITDPQALAEERKKSNAINRAALHHMVRCKHEGHIVLVFPSGTRYRPGNPDTKRGLKEIDSYLKAFDHMVLVGISGNLLRINPSGEMAEDILARDTVVFRVSPIIDCAEFRSRAREGLPPDADAKQITADRIMQELEKLHAEIEALP
ncbi:MAG: 1-acyl-sn-glycerol-3-phosphate acyltransferase [Spirochaetales bacterium]|jgi:glycerol-3-phosphate O-acyltransferase|nr:1-acyl-sn-glycerol-3-phosphate acyltransferase [Spirochaetales bacterium]